MKFLKPFPLLWTHVLAHKMFSALLPKLRRDLSHSFSFMITGLQQWVVVLLIKRSTKLTISIGKFLTSPRIAPPYDLLISEHVTFILRVLLASLLKLVACIQSAAISSHSLPSKFSFPSLAISGPIVFNHPLGWYPLLHHQNTYKCTYNILLQQTIPDM